MNFGKNLKFLLKKEQISENELSKRTGISQQIINRIVSGENINPKLSTILPLANYFKIPLQDLIYNYSVNNITPSSKSSLKIPYIEFIDLETSGIDIALTRVEKYITVDILNPTKHYFATSMYDDSMEPKFSKGSILVFEKDKDLNNGDFCLLKGEENVYLFRQIMINSADKKYIKCLNPTFDGYKIVPLPINIYVLATLLESRTNFFSL
jgi:transcriptional regulator with XRE-family HTH domain